MATLAERHNVKIRGEGNSVVVFAHGFGCDQLVWRDVAPAFEDDYRVVLFDLAALGRADPKLYDTQRHSTLDGYALDLIALLDSMELSQVHVVAHSVSTVITALAAIRRPDLFASIVMICPSACYLNDGEYRGGFDPEMLDQLIDLLEANFVDWARVFAPIVIGNPDRPGFTEEFVETLCRADPRFVAPFARVTFFSDRRQDMPKVGVPVTILQCQEDPVAPESAIIFVHEAIPGSRLIQLEATGHCPHITHPAETTETVRRALFDPAPGAGT